MNGADPVPREERCFLSTGPGPSGERSRGGRAWRLARVGWFAGYAAVVTILFGASLFSLARYAAGTELHSHILLIPFISGWLLWTGRPALSAVAGPGIAGAVLFLAAAAAGLATALVPEEAALSQNDSLAATTASYLCFLVAGGFFFLGGNWMKAAAFPLFFLVFMVPLPDGMVVAMEDAAIFTSAEVAHRFFEATGTPVYLEGLALHLPGIVIEVARECSGIRSSWVLFITGVLASHLFLASPWRRAALVAATIPLGILRNGFRILVIGLLCIREGPHMIDSGIHREGGPVFFGLSLVALMATLWLLRRGDGIGRRSSLPEK